MADPKKEQEKNLKALEGDYIQMKILKILSVLNLLRLQMREKRSQRLKKLKNHLLGKSKS